MRRQAQSEKPGTDTGVTRVKTTKPEGPSDQRTKHRPVRAHQGLGPRASHCAPPFRAASSPVPRWVMAVAHS
jgi:hypothetical protein